MISRHSTARFEYTFLGLLLWALFTSWLPQRLFLSIYECGIFALVCAWLAVILSRNISFAVPPAIAAILILPCFGFVQLAAGLSVYAGKTADATLDWTAIAATAWLAWQFSADAGFRQLFRRVLVITGVIVSILGVVHWHTSSGRILWHWPNPWQQQATIPLLNHSHFAAFVELALAPAVWEAMRKRTLDRFNAWAAAIMVGAVWAVGSRSGSVIVSLELAGALLLTVRHSTAQLFSRKRAKAIVAPAIFVIAVIGLEGVAARIVSLPHSEFRAVFLRASVDMLKARPLTGFGLGAWANVYPAYAPVEIGYLVEHANNDWLEWADEGGLAFAAILGGLGIFSLRRAWSETWCLGIVAAFVQALVEFPMHKPAVAAFQFAALACAAAVVSPSGHEVERPGADGSWQTSVELLTTASRKRLT